MEPKGNRYFSILIFLLVILIGGLIYYYAEDIKRTVSPASFRDPIIVHQQQQEMLPAELAGFKIVDEKAIRVYEIQSRSLADGGTQYTARYDTNDLQAEYDHAKQALQSNKQFLLQADSYQMGLFTLGWSRSVERFQVTGVSSGGPGGTVVLSYYKRL